jgi:hypothetical protein
MTMTLSETPTNQKKLAQLQRALTELCTEVLRRGFHGAASVELSVQDGTIQRIRCRVERIEQ